LIDLWAQQTNYKDIANVDMNQQEEFLKTAQANVEEFKDKTTFHRMLSTEAAKLLPDKSLDLLTIIAESRRICMPNGPKYNWVGFWTPSFICKLSSDSGRFRILVK